MCHISRLFCVFNSFALFAGFSGKGWGPLRMSWSKILYQRSDDQRSMIVPSLFDDHCSGGRKWPSDSPLLLPNLGAGQFSRPVIIKLYMNLRLTTTNTAYQAWIDGFYQENVKKCRIDKMSWHWQKCRSDVIRYLLPLVRRQSENTIEAKKWWWRKCRNSCITARYHQNQILKRTPGCHEKQLNSAKNQLKMTPGCRKSQKVQIRCFGHFAKNAVFSGYVG